MAAFPDPRSYHFATGEHWAKGVSDGLRVEEDGSLMPERRIGGVVRRIDAPGAAGPAFSADGTAYWLAGGKLNWLASVGGTARAIEAPGPVRSSGRIVIGRHWLWTMSPGAQALDRYALASLRHDIAPALPAPVRDIAGDGRDGLWCLLGAPGKAAALLHFDPKGCPGKVEPLPDGVADPTAIAALRRPTRLFLLTAQGRSLYRLDRGKSGWDGDFLPFEDGFAADLLASDGRHRMFLAAKGGRVLRSVDRCGRLIEDTPLDESGLNGIAARGDALLLTASGATLYYDAASGASAPGSRGTVVTPPLLLPPANLSTAWLRAVMRAELPEGAALELRAVSTSDPDLHDSIETAFRRWDPSGRWDEIAGLKGEIVKRRILYAGAHRDEGQDPKLLAFPLFDQHRWLWLELRLTASPAGARPRLHGLDVLYSENRLARQVPAIFVADVSGRDPNSGDPTGFFHELLGILETTTQGLDSSIAGLGRRIHPASAEGPYQDFVAGWMDLPWDQTLDPGRKRRLLEDGGALLDKRGSKDGLRSFLERLMPEAVIVITDFDVDVGIGLLGRSPLPLLMSGLPADAVCVSRKAVVGMARLPCPGDDRSGTRGLRGVVRILIFAEETDRVALAPILPRLIAALIPAGLRARIRWRPASAAGRARLDCGVRLDPPRRPRLDGGGRLGNLTLAPRAALADEAELDADFDLV